MCENCDFARNTTPVPCNPPRFFQHDKLIITYTKPKNQLYFTIPFLGYGCVRVAAILVALEAQDKKESNFYPELNFYPYIQ